MNGQHVEDFCFSILSKEILEGSVGEEDLVGALLLRIQSGTNLRSGNLRQDVHWGDVHKEVSLQGLPVFSMNVINTKIGSSTAASSVVDQHRMVTRHMMI